MSSPTPRKPNRPRGALGGIQSRRWNTLLLVALIAVAAWLTVPGLGPNVLGLGTGGTNTGENEPLLAQLEELRLDLPQGTPEYDRAEFGDGWADLDGDDCNTRNEILARDLTDVTYRQNTNDCVVQAGVLDEPYTGETVEFERGEGTSELVQIDHVVALGNAWRSGAWQWDDGQRLRFANDPLNLLAVDGEANYDKGASSADQWLPPNDDFVCEYVARQVAVKHKWDLSVTPKEATAMREILSSCPEVTIDE